MCHRRRALPEPDLLGHCSQTRPQNVGCFYPATLDYCRPDGQIRGIRWGASGRRWKRISWSLTLLLFLPGMCLWAMRCLALQQPSSDRVLTDQGQKRAREAASLWVSSGFGFSELLWVLRRRHTLSLAPLPLGSLSPALTHPHRSPSSLFTPCLQSAPPPPGCALETAFL